MLAGSLVWSLGTALFRSTSDPVSARLAEWGRDHHLGGVVSFLENQQLNLSPATTGGRVAGGFSVGGTPLPRGARTTRVPADLTPFDTGQPGEGVWEVLVRVHGQPALLHAGLAPDAAHTSYAAAVAWLDPKLLRVQLRPGVLDPGGTWPGYPPTLARYRQSPGLVAAFNAGFRLNGESHGGFYLAGRTARPLVDGAASLVVRTDGTIAIGAWGREVTMSPRVQGVRQNLQLLIDHGIVSPTVDEDRSAVWGRTVGGTRTTWRSGAGVTASGAVVYVDGPALSTRTLAEVLKRAGAVEAMELDINPQWTHLDWFDYSTSGVTAHRLNPGQHAPPTHYLSAQPSSRDFFAVLAR